MNYKRAKLDNGIELVSVYLPESTSISLFVIIKAGSANEPIPGLAHFIEHCVFKGTKNRPSAFKINQEIEQVGGYMNAATSQEFTEFYVKIPFEYAKRGFDVLADILTQSIFDPAELEKEKDVVIEEIHMYEDMPVRNVSDSFYSLMWQKNPLGRAILGSEETVKSITREDIINCMNKWFKADNIIVSVAGNISYEDSLAFTQEYFGSIKPGAQVIEGVNVDSLSWFDKAHEVETYDGDDVMVRVEKRNVKQMHLCYGYSALSYTDNEIYPLEVGSAILAEGSSSYLWQKIREEMGVSYYLDCEIDAFKQTGLWYLHTGIDEDRIQEVIAVFQEALEKLKNKEFNEGDLMRAKEYLKGDFKMNLEGSEEHARYVGHELLEHDSITSVNEESAKIDAVSMDQISNVFKRVESGKLFVNSLTKETTLNTLRTILKR